MLLQWVAKKLKVKNSSKEKRGQPKKKKGQKRGMTPPNMGVPKNFPRLTNKMEKTAGKQRGVVTF